MLQSNAVLLRHACTAASGSWITHLELSKGTAPAVYVGNFVHVLPLQACLKVHGVYTAIQHGMPDHTSSEVSLSATA
jgi:hypothetical protein